MTRKRGDTRPQVPATKKNQIAKSSESREVTSVSAVDVLCFVDFIRGGNVEGWAFDTKDVGRTIVVMVHVDGKLQNQVECSLERGDVKDAGFPKSACGFRFALSAKFLDGKSHTLQIIADEVAIPFMYYGNKVERAEFSEKITPILHGAIDGFEHGQIKGWVILEDPVTRKLSGGCQLLITCDGVACGNTRADWVRMDVASELNCDAACGFQFSPPDAFKSTLAREYRFFVMPGRIELPQSPHVTSFIDNRVEGAMRKITTDLARVYAEVGRLRSELGRLIPSSGHNLGRYHLWVEKYLPALSQRVAQVRSRGRRQQRPLVSIVMPIFRPRLIDFKHAVESVVQQTYQNWELILVDDGSDDSELSKLIDELVKKDHRVFFVGKETNSGISASTNEALKIARGDWIAFFDHDDILVEVALEMMIDAAVSRGAQLVYSDEDKIDQAGHYLEPAFKPDWNYRLLLSVNYICHFVMVTRELANKVGPFNSRIDGAQDHDFLLRAAEILEPQLIHHVPEILYHWRISPSSTAASTAAKPYAILAGQVAIQEHLKRQNKIADVVPINGKTFYKIKWVLDTLPKVAIIIPFKDQSALTQRCIESVLAVTKYQNFEIILVDNWSTDASTTELIARYSQSKNIFCMRVEEEFNYSRLNNLAVAKSDAEFFVFLNNDVFVDQADWLTNIVSEAIADPAVAAVGGKLLYPDSTVQHGGVVTGIGGVAGHTHTGARSDAPGYGGRLWFAQEITAVTAACMLVRASVFHEVGGFDEADLKVAFNDVDLCLKIRAAGYKIIWTPELVAEHHESVSRGFDTHNEKEMRFFREVEVMKMRWKDVLNVDPFYNKNFLLDGRPYFDLVDPTDLHR